MNEIWKGLIYNNEDYSEWLEISNLGRIRNSKTMTIRKQNLLKSGYCFITFSMGSRKNKKTIRVHKAIAETFINNPYNKLIINHKDGNKLNNKIENLEWSTYSENTIHAYKNKLIKTQIQINNKNFKLKLEDVFYIINNYKSRDENFGARALGRKFNVAHITILRILKNKDFYENLK